MVFDKQHRVVKISAIVYGLDPLDNIRVLLRHSKPFDLKHRDEWTFVWGCVEAKETLLHAATREVLEEFGLTEFCNIQMDDLTTEFTGLHGNSIAHYCFLEVPSVEVRIVLNEESIGYDWMLVKDAQRALWETNQKNLLNRFTRKK